MTLLAESPAPPRAWLWVQLVIGWLPAWALFTLLMLAVHEMPPMQAMLGAARLAGIAALLGLLVLRGAARWPWPHPWRWRFLAAHALGAVAYSIAWLLLNSLFESAMRGQLVLIRGPGFTAFFVTGVWLYAMVAGVAYAQRAARAAAEAQALQARTRLATLRAQLHPHFLFNALHTVVQLIGLDPRRATQAAEELAALLRATLDDERDWLTLREEWQLVQRYLAIEQLRLGDRLRVQADIDDAALDAQLPSFALQTLIENAVSHAAAPRVEPTSLRIRATRERGATLTLVLSVSDDGPGAAAGFESGAGSGLRRLRERMAVLHGSAAGLSIDTAPGQGFRATLRIVQGAAE